MTPHSNYNSGVILSPNASEGEGSINTESVKQKTYNFEELRKKHPRMGKKWLPEEDERLKKLYQNEREAGFKDFDSFINTLTQKFERASGGLKARLAMHFTDVPGWDYEKQKQRDEARAKEKAESNSAKATSDKETSAINKTEDVEEEIPQLDLSDNPQAQEALRLMEETRENIFLTGEAGTGKSTLLNYFRHTTQKNLVVLAPTGVAALNVEGQTIHSFCSFGPDITLSKVKKLGPFNPRLKLVKNLDTVIIDEISMVRADLLDFVDKFFRLNGPMSSLPFGGIQVVFIGDLYQLPPVEKDFVVGGSLIKEYESPYFFDSRAFKNSDFNFVELKTIYRQKDQVFKDVLNAVRNNAATQEHIELLNSRAKNEGRKFTFEKFAIYLTPTNNRAREINNFFLEKINSEIKNYEGVALGSFEDRETPTDLNLQIKLGAQIMMLNNDTKKRWVNGTMGKILRIDPAVEEVLENGVTVSGSDNIIVELETGEIVNVIPHTWEMFQFVLQKSTQKVDSKTTGTFTQYPFKLAWAVTIHKAQGKTFDKVYVDLSTGTFAHGQLYVALSRCRTLEGLYLRRNVEQKDIILDQRIVKFLRNLVESKK